MPRKKCKKCNKKIKSLLPIACKCKEYFCGKHKIPHDHDCSFDYINEKKEQLKIQNPKIIPEKLPGLTF